MSVKKFKSLIHGLNENDDYHTFFLLPVVQHEWSFRMFAIKASNY